MTQSFGTNGIDGTPASASKRSKAFSLACVLRSEFCALHRFDPKRTMRPARGQPVADPSLPPAANGEETTKQADTDKTPSQQPKTSPEAKALERLWQNIHSLSGDGRTALCLSGGGVRSAAFNLGVLQGLARLELLDRFHYLSTVSGGGYIGCWLSAWRYRCEKGISDVSRDLSWPDRIGNAEVFPQVPHAIGNLRRSTNYLTPVTGLLSPDTWTTILIVGRNLMLNHLVIVPLVAALLLSAKLVGAVAHGIDWWKSWNDLLIGIRFDSLAFRYMSTLLLPGVFATLGWIIFSIARPSWDVRWVPKTMVEHESSAQSLAPKWGIALVLLGAFSFAFLVGKGIPQGEAHFSWSFERFVAFPIGGSVGALVAFVLAVVLATVNRARCKMPEGAEQTVRVVTVPTAGVYAVSFLAVAAFVAGAAGGVVLGVGEELAAHLPTGPYSTALLMSIAPLWFVLSYNAGDAVFLGMTVRRPNPKGQLEWSDRWGDEEREWVARTAGFLSVIALGVSILFLLSLFGPTLIKFVVNSWTGPFGLATIGILSALASVGLAASPFSTHSGTASEGARLPVRKIIALATPIFAGLLAALLSTALDAILFGKPLLKLLSMSEQDYVVGWFDPRTCQGLRELFLLACFLAVFSFLAAGFVNINRFSLYDLYRMRLTREFLGASNGSRRPEVWTGFDESDDIPLAGLWPPNDKRKRLYPVINVALNMAATARVEWQERKAVSFVFTPLCSGSGATSDLGFRKTKEYASGIMLGWAMSVSGAAVSPNAGYSTMPGLALLMTLFNLRLGIWAGNPGKAGEEIYKRRGPNNALIPLLREALTRTNDRAKNVFLSDGGHFDNLGVYEMLRRRCRFIVISDATADPDYVYADLGNVVRKAAIDFGIRITFRHLDMPRRGETAVKGAYSAYAVIEYPETQSSGRRQRGQLLYIKAYCGGLEEPADVRAYSLANPAFPHDSTLNQFFGEAQFESYRALGAYTVRELARHAGFAATREAANPKSLSQFFRGARKGLAKSPAAGRI
jgi:Patatin-like phospholipase